MPWRVDVDGEHSSEQVGPAETPWARGGLGGVAVRGAGASEVEVEGEVLWAKGVRNM